MKATVVTDLKEKQHRITTEGKQGEREKRRLEDYIDTFWFYGVGITTTVC